MMQTIKAKMHGMTVSSLISQIYEFAVTEGVWFAVYALLMDVLDELVIPLTLAYFGHPVIGGLAFIGDLDWLTYPAYFMIRMKKQEVIFMIKRLLAKTSVF